MKVLFICLGNIERSKLAEVWYNSLTKSKDAFSAGANVEKLGIKGKTIGCISNEKNKNISNYDVKLVIKIMKEKGFDISDEKTTLLDKEMTEKADKIVSFIEKKDLPKYVDFTKVIFWDIPDGKYGDYVSHCKINENIKKLVIDLIKKV